MSYSLSLCSGLRILLHRDNLPDDDPAGEFSVPGDHADRNQGQQSACSPVHKLPEDKGIHLQASARRKIALHASYQFDSSEFPLLVTVYITIIADAVKSLWVKYYPQLGFRGKVLRIGDDEHPIDGNKRNFENLLPGTCVSGIPWVELRGKQDTKQ